MGVLIKQRDGDWWVYINLNGRRKAKKIGKDKDLAKDVAKKITAKIALGEFNMMERDCPTFEEHAEKWLAIPCADDRKEGTMKDYEGTLKRHVYAAFGKHRLNEITKGGLKEFFDGLLVKGLQPATLLTIRAPITDILNHAVDAEIIERNPMNDLKIGGATRKDTITPLTDEEAALLLAAAKTHFHGYYYPHFLCALRTGMRIGEIEALQWGDVDFNGRFIEVQRSCRKGRITDTKNRKRRRVDMSTQLVKALKAWRVFQTKTALEAGRPLSEFVFASKKGKRLCRHAFKYALHTCLKKAGLRRIRVHDLRHSYATIRLSRGHNIGDVSHQMGHSSIGITDKVYLHWIPGKFKSEVNELDTVQPSATLAQPERTGRRRNNVISIRRV